LEALGQRAEQGGNGSNQHKSKGANSAPVKTTRMTVSGVRNEQSTTNFSEADIFASFTLMNIFYATEFNH
jgi:hypothetical protein